MGRDVDTAQFLEEGPVSGSDPAEIVRFGGGRQSWEERRRKHPRSPRGTVDQRPFGTAP